MKPPPFSYHDPQSVAEVIALLGKLENARLLAGGQSLMPMLNMRLAAPDHIVDLNGVAALSYIKEEGDALAIGAMTRQRDVEFDARVRARCPLMHEAVLQVGHRQTRNRGTLGGSLCQLDPSAELVAVAAALDAVVTVQGPSGARDVEKMLTGAGASPRLFSEAGEACRKLDCMEDVHVTAAYRRQLAAVLARRALEKAHERVARN